MAELEICLLGTFQVCWDFAPVSATVWRDPYAARLLKLVLLKRPTAIAAPDAAALLGRGATADRVRTAAAAVQRVLGAGAALALDPEDRVTFTAGTRCWIDLDALQAHHKAGLNAMARGDMLPAILAFQEADALYQGDLLDELQDAWVVQPRKQLQAMYTEILDHLAEGHAVLGRYQDAVGFCHKALSRDPAREVTFQRMMVYYYYLGDTAGLTETYQACRDALEGAGRSPGPETATLWDQLNRGSVTGWPASLAAATVERNPPKE